MPVWMPDKIFHHIEYHKILLFECSRFFSFHGLKVVDVPKYPSIDIFSPLPSAQSITIILMADDFIVEFFASSPLGKYLHHASIYHAPIRRNHPSTWCSHLQAQSTDSAATQRSSSSDAFFVWTLFWYLLYVYKRSEFITKWSNKGSTKYPRRSRWQAERKMRQKGTQWTRTVKINNSEVQY